MGIAHCIRITRTLYMDDGRNQLISQSIRPFLLDSNWTASLGGVDSSTKSSSAVSLTGDPISIIETTEESMILFMRYLFV